MNKKLWLKILIPVLIVAVIAAMWLVKNGGKADEQQPGTSTKPATDGADFSLNATEQIDFTALSKYGLPIIADYGATSCIPCKEMAPVLEKLNAEMQGKAFIKFVDVWEYFDAAANVPIQMIPTQVFFTADGKPFVPSASLSKQIAFKMEYDKAGNHIFTLHVGGLTEAQMRLILAEMGVE